jgi:hypothetical protein
MQLASVLALVGCLLPATLHAQSIPLPGAAAWAGH